MCVGSILLVLPYFIDIYSRLNLLKNDMALFSLAPTRMTCVHWFRSPRVPGTMRYR